MGFRTSHSGHVDPELAAMIVWRRRRLEQAGFDRGRAEQLAGDRRTDVHALLELVDRGCPPDLAARILAPLDSETQELR
jgi:hypothetical protein